MVHRAIHLRRLFRIFQPPFRPVYIHVLAKDITVAVDNPCVDAHYGPGGNLLAANGRAACGDNALWRKAGGRVDAEGFFDASVEVWKLGCFGEGKRGEAVHLCDEPSFDVWILEDVVEECGKAGHAGIG